VKEAFSLQPSALSQRIVEFSFLFSLMAKG
jgi:hypothetical protein